jgi:hypothetical protein
MPTQSLTDYLAAHPECATLEDSDVANLINAPTETVYVETMRFNRSIVAALGTQDGMAFIMALRNASEANPLIAMALEWLKPSEGGVDLGHITTHEMLAVLVGAGILQQASVDRLKALAERSVGWFEKQHGRPVHHLEIAAVRRP